MQRRNLLTSTVLSLGLLFGLVSAVGSPATAATPIQPGARIVSGDSACTMNFIYREILEQPDNSVSFREDPSGERRTGTSDDDYPAFTEEPRLFAGTAGHCVKGVGARVSTDDGTFGTVAFHRLNEEVGDDFAFIEIDRDKEHLVNPTMLGFDGPNGVMSGREARQGDGAHVYGHGLILGQTEFTRPRSGTLTRSDSTSYGATLPVIFGDSGGPVLHENGSALGIVAHLVVSLDFTTLDGNTVEHALRVAAANGLDLEVVRG